MCNKVLKNSIFWQLYKSLPETSLAIKLTQDKYLLAAEGLTLAIAFYTRPLLSCFFQPMEMTSLRKDLFAPNKSPLLKGTSPLIASMFSPTGRENNPIVFITNLRNEFREWRFYFSQLSWRIPRWLCNFSLWCRIASRITECHEKKIVL